MLKFDVLKIRSLSLL